AEALGRQSATQLRLGECSPTRSCLHESVRPIEDLLRVLDALPSNENLEAGVRCSHLDIHHPSRQPEGIVRQRCRRNVTEHAPSAVTLECAIKPCGAEALHCAHSDAGAAELLVIPSHSPPAPLHPALPWFT